MIYAEALVSDQVLVAKDVRRGYPNDKDGSGDDFRHAIPALALLRADKRINGEATPVFFAINTFKLTPWPGLGRFSVFTKYAPLLRRVVVELVNQHSVGYWTGVARGPSTHRTLVHIWGNQIRALASMANLQFLEVNVHSMRAEVVRGNATWNQLILELKPQLIASVPSSVRHKKGVRGCGIWLSVSVDNSYLDVLDRVMKTFMETKAVRTLSDNMHKIGEGWRQIGVNFELEGPYHPPTRSSGCTDSGPCYYG